MNIKKYIGDAVFYKRAFSVILPILVQNVITNFVSLLDNIMVGRVGTEPMSGVAVANQLIFVFNLAVFGMVAGAGIYGAQFYGKGDHKGVAHTLKIKIISVMILTLVFLGIFAAFGNEMLMAFLHQGNSDLDLQETFRYSRQYLTVIMVCLIPFALTQAFAGTLRETDNSNVPMKAGLAAVFVNLFFNYVLIYGKFGAPALGAEGAAIATALSRFVELTIILVWILKNRDICRFMDHLKLSERIPEDLTKEIIIVGTPMFINELMWGAGITMLTQCMSTRGLEIVSALNISSTVDNLFKTVFLSIGVSLSIIVGQLLGSGDTERAVEEDRKMIALSFASTCVIALIMQVVAPLFPMLYNTTDQVRGYATLFIRVISVLMPMHAVINASYFTIRSGGKTFITFLFDSVYTWAVNVSTAAALAYLTSIPIIPMYIIIYLTDIPKLVIGLILVTKRTWVKDLVE